MVVLAQVERRSLQVHALDTGTLCIVRCHQGAARAAKLPAWTLISIQVTAVAHPHTQPCAARAHVKGDAIEPDQGAQQVDGHDSACVVSCMLIKLNFQNSEWMSFTWLARDARQAPRDAAHAQLALEPLAIDGAHEAEADLVGSLTPRAARAV